MRHVANVQKKEKENVKKMRERERVKKIMDQGIQMREKTLGGQRKYINMRREVW